MVVTHKLLDCNKIVVTLKLLVGQVGVQELRTYFLRRRLISTEKAVLYAEGAFLKTRSNEF